MKRRPFYIGKWRTATYVGFCITCLFLLLMEPYSDSGYISLNLACHTDSISLMSQASSTNEISRENNCDGFHLIIFFSLLSNNSTRASDSKFQRREKEYIDTLVSNLNHPIVCKVYVFSPKPEDFQRLIREKYGITHPNLKIHKSHPNPHYADMFRFASVNLQNKVVAILNADIQLGEGFDEFGATWWMNHPTTMHALTRQLPLSDCKIRQIGDYCTHEKSRYVGSHDVFIFYLKHPFPEHFLQELCFPSIYLGSENVIMWAFRNILRFNVRNPCLKLKVHHNHCSGVVSHADDGYRVNVNGKSALASYTSNLEDGS